MRTWISHMIRRRNWVMAICLLFTAGLMSQLGRLAIIINSDNMLPQSNRLIKVGNEVERTFGNKYTVVIGVTANEGTIYRTDVLEKVKRITDRILEAPGVIRANVIGLAARKAKAIGGNEEGMTATPLMERVPRTDREMEALKTAVASNPVYRDLLVSKDGKTTQIVMEFREMPGGMKDIERSVRAAIAPEKDGSVDISVGGLVIFLALLEKFSARMAFLLPLSILLVGLIHYEAFRTFQALLLPLVTAGLAVIWSLSFLALSRQPMDVFNASTPILILAIAAGHAVQILKRYYEEFAKLREADPEGDRREQNRLAVLAALTRMGPVMAVACAVAALGFFSLTIFEIKSIRTFGILTGIGVLSALILELTFIPALRSALPPPGDREQRREKAKTFWDAFVGALYRLVSQRPRTVNAVAVAALAALSLGGYLLKIENSQKGFFYGDLETRRDDDKLNARMAGTNTLYVLVDGGGEDSLKSPRILEAMAKVQQRLALNPKVGKTISIVDFIERMNQAMNADRAEFHRIPESRELVAQYLLLYSNSGEPGDFDSYVDYGYRKGVIQAFVKTDNSQVLQAILAGTQAYADSVFPGSAVVRIGGGAIGSLALDQEMIRGKVLNILQIMGAVFLVSSLVFRSLLAGILILVPLIATVFANFGFMGLLGIPLNIPTSLVSAMAVGVGADYAIYLSFRLREELASGRSEAEALKSAYLSAGKAILFVSTAVAGGFGVLMFSWGFWVHNWMGFLIGLAMLVSSLSTLTIFTSLILTLRPRFIFSAARKASPARSPAPAFTGGMAGISGLLLWAGAAAYLVFGAGRAQADVPNDQTVAESNAAPGGGTKTPSAEDITMGNFLASKVANSASDATFHLFNAAGQERVRVTRGMTKLIPGTTDNMRLVEFLSPADVRGTKTLLIEHSGKEDDIWVYLPAMKKVRRVVSNNKKDAFVGTDFSYGDVVGQKVAEWSHRLIKEEKVDGKDCYVVESLPKTAEAGAVSGYSKRVSWIDRESRISLRGEAYDPGGRLLKTFSARDVRLVDPAANKWQPMKLIAENVQTGHKTVLEFTDFKANPGVPEDAFTAHGLEK